MRRNYIRIAKGRANRIGHNWEAVAEWFIDRFTTGARFWTQNHRIGGMDSRRITLHLIKGVGGGGTVSRSTGFGRSRPASSPSQSATFLAANGD
jgi:hypothetical protein